MFSVKCVAVTIGLKWHSPIAVSQTWHWKW